MENDIKIAYATWAKANGLKITRPAHAFKFNECSLRCIKGAYKLQIIREMTDEVQLKWHRDEQGNLPADGVNAYDYPIFSGTKEQLLRFFKTGETQLQQMGK